MAGDEIEDDHGQAEELGEGVLLFLVCFVGCLFYGVFHLCWCVCASFEMGAEKYTLQFFPCVHVLACVPQKAAPTRGRAPCAAAGGRAGPRGGGPTSPIYKLIDVW